MSLSASIPKTNCPPSVADLLQYCGLDPEQVGDDWLDVINMAGDLGALD